jgi:hypothetical protein
MAHETRRSEQFKLEAPIESPSMDSLRRKEPDGAGALTM